MIAKATPAYIRTVENSCFLTCTPTTKFPLSVCAADEYAVTKKRFLENTCNANSSTFEIDTEHGIYSVLFTEDGKHVLSGGEEGMLRQWRVGDGHEMGEPIQVE